MSLTIRLETRVTDEAQCVDKVSSLKQPSIRKSQPFPEDDFLQDSSFPSYPYEEKDSIVPIEELCHRLCQVQHEAQASETQSYVKVRIPGSEAYHLVLVDTGSCLCLCDFVWALKNYPNFEMLFVAEPNTVSLGDQITKMTICGHFNMVNIFESREGVRLVAKQKYFCLTA